MKDSSQIPVIRRLLGTIVPGHVYLFHGQHGVGKTVLGLQMAQSWIRGGGVVLYLSTVRPSEFFQHAADMGLPLEGHWRNHQLILGEFGFEAAEQFRELGAEAFLERVADAAEQLPVAGVVIDTLEPLIETSTNCTQLREQLTALVDGLSRRGWTTLLLAGSKVLRDRSGAGDLLRELCWATVSVERAKQNLWERVRGEKPPGSILLKIEKARQPTPSGAELPCEIVQGAGLLPAPDAAEVAGATGSGASPLEPGTLSKALLISPDEGIFDSLTELLEDTVQVQTATDGVDGLTRAVTWSPQVVLAETELPKLSGFGIARALRQGHYGMPILLVSRSSRRHSERVRGYLNGATDFLYYPFDVRELVYKVRVMSQMALHTFDAGVEEQMMDVLLSKARSHILTVPAFLQALSLSLHTGERLSAPVSLLGFSFGGADPKGNAGVWERFRDLIDTQARNGDLICFPTAFRAAVLLCHETERGAGAFARRLRRELHKAGLHGIGRPGSWEISMAGRTIQLPRGKQPDLRAILDEAFSSARPIMVGGQASLTSDESQGGSVAERANPPIEPPVEPPADSPGEQDLRERRWGT